MEYFRIMLLFLLSTHLFLLVSPSYTLNPHNLAMMASRMKSSYGYDDETTKCANAFSSIMNGANITSKADGPDPLQVIFISSGKSINDLGNYKYCSVSQNLTSK
jgi:hypothetical protein